MNTSIVSVRKTSSLSYPDVPFSPNKLFPEFKDFDVYDYIINEDGDNEIYEAVRKILIDLELDVENVGKNKWNPLADLVKKTQKVILKPNLVFDRHPIGRLGSLSSITHASVVRPLIDYILLATNGQVEIVICDVPLQSADWNNLLQIGGLKELVDFYSKGGIKINVLDFRREIALINKEEVIYEKNKQKGDPNGYCSVDLGVNSFLTPIIKYSKLFEITDYPPGTVIKHHNDEVNEYCIPRTVLEADLFINLPKLKTHRKAGMTFSLKNLIGINGDKSWIAHHRRGVKMQGGDEVDNITLTYLKSRVMSFMKRYKATNFFFIFVKTYLSKQRRHRNKKAGTGCRKEYLDKNITEGSWYGNDTLWRVINDINVIIFYANKSGVLQENIQRKYLCIGDGIIAADQEGPMKGRPRKAGLLIGGLNPVCIDRVAASVIGFDYKKIPQIKEGFRLAHWTICATKEQDIIWKSNLKNIKKTNFKFKPTEGWLGFIERD